ncbi:hypothetical protein KY285_011694 [Solanum tuberosum]|nr:hypothetical protein KY285_011694 [Solanum tuberosum]
MEEKTGIWGFITSGKEKVKYVCHCIGNGEGGKEISKIYADTIREIETESREKQDRSCDNEIIGNLSKITNGTGPVILLDGAEKLENIRELKLGCENRVQVDSFAYQTPEDVLRFFMMMEFMGTRYLNNLLVHDNCQQKKV